MKNVVVVVVVAVLPLQSCADGTAKLWTVHDWEEVQVWQRFGRIVANLTSLSVLY